MTCDVLVIAPHPDDAELHCGATLAKLSRLGHKVVVADCTEGELGTRGDISTRYQESAEAARILGLHDRVNLQLTDGHVTADPQKLITSIAQLLRHWRPSLTLGMSPTAKHPDHIALGRHLAAACKAAALHKYHPQPTISALPHSSLFFYEAELPCTNPSFIHPVSENDWDCKIRAIHAYGSQFTPQQDHQTTSITQHGFLDWVDARGRTWGHHAGSTYAEAFTAPTIVAANNLMNLFTY